MQEAIVVGYRALVEAWEERYERALLGLEEATAHFRRAGDIGMLGEFQAWTAACEVAKGESQLGARHFEEARWISLDGLPDAALWVPCMEASAHAAAGSMPEARAALARAELASVRFASRDVQIVDTARAHLGLLAAFETRSRDAGAALRAASEHARALLSQPIATTLSMRLPTHLARAALGRTAARGGPSIVPPASTTPPAAYAIEVSGRRFRPPTGDWISLGADSPQARVLAALALTLTEPTSAALPWQALAAVAWPEAVATDRRARDRVYQAIRRIRDAGLGEALVTTPDGYRLSREVAIEVVKADGGDRPSGRDDPR